ncbi:MAG: hypothetical protein KBA31_19430 [Alphaproteobacteria bacterium]|nr:hypothetical protein [Alphaproteobacteria bacterium]
MNFHFKLALFLVFLAVAPSVAADRPAVWEVVGRCETLDTAAPGQGLLYVRIKRRDLDVEVIDVRGCGKNRSLHKVFKWGGEVAKVRVYALPFFKKGQLDIIVESGLDETSDFYLYAAAQGYKEVVRWTAYNGPFFAGYDDGRWGVLLIDVAEITCANGSTWAKKVLAVRGLTLTAEDVCGLPE